MDFKISCANWIKEDDEKVLILLQEAQKWLSAEELSEKTGLPLHKVAHTLKLLKQQMDFSDGRAGFFKED